jgi:hypothetical protein
MKMGTGPIFLHFFILPVIKMGPVPIFNCRYNQKWDKKRRNVAGFVPK